MQTTSNGLERKDVHQSLLRTPLFAGVEMGILIMEGALGVAVIFMGGFQLLSAMAAGVVIVAVHIPLKKLVKADQAMIAIIPAALRYNNYYPATSDVHGKSKAKRSITSITTSV